MRGRESSIRGVIGGLFAAVCLLSAGGPSDARIQPGSPDLLQAGRLQTGNLLVAAPGMPDPRFRRSVILIVKHSAKGAFGLLVNRPVGTVDISKLFREAMPEGTKETREVEIHYGGPVQPRRGFVLYKSEKPYPESIPVGKGVSVSSHPSLLRAIARGEGPEKTVILLGYAGWAPGQLEAEMRRGDWYTAPVDEDILFDKGHPTKWKRAMDRRFRTL